MPTCYNSVQLLAQCLHRIKINAHLVAERLSVRLIIVQARRALVGSWSVTGLRTVYVSLWHVPLKMQYCDGDRGLGGRHQNESRDMEEG